MPLADTSVPAMSYRSSFTAAHAQRVRRGMLLSAAQGRHSGPVPAGYTANVRRRGVPVPDPAQAMAVSEAFAFSLDGISLRKMLPKVRLLGLKGRDGRPISLTTLARILSNPFYPGYVRHNGKMYPGLHEPIVSERDFQRVQQLLTKRQCP
jgi:site-specific DNA recombinase